MTAAVDHALEVALRASLEPLGGASAEGGSLSPSQASPRIQAAVLGALAAVQRAHPRLRGRFVAGWLPVAPRNVWLRYSPPGAQCGDEPTRQWLYRADTDPALIELDPSAGSTVGAVAVDMARRLRSLARRAKREGAVPFALTAGQTALELEQGLTTLDAALAEAKANLERVELHLASVTAPARAGWERARGLAQRALYILQREGRFPG